ncbi:MAG: BON domain-containing protein [Gammaproteobacteria bacterium]|nr:BON domain-containing protein [Gammaproteobacteria bacterium]
MIQQRPATFSYRLLAVVLGLACATALPGCGPIVLVGTASGVMMANDKRSAGTIVDDNGIELKLGNKIASDKTLADKVHVSATCYNKTLLLTGEVPSEEIRDQIIALAGAIDGVKQVYNALDISVPTEYKSRNFDTWVTTKAKSKLLGRKELEGASVKVTTENAVVYLMGLVYHADADTAAQTVSEIEGVKRVVKVFEYLD